VKRILEYLPYLNEQCTHPHRHRHRPSITRTTVSRAIHPSVIDDALPLLLTCLDAHLMLPSRLAGGKRSTFPAVGPGKSVWNGNTSGPNERGISKRHDENGHGQDTLHCSCSRSVLPFRRSCERMLSPPKCKGQTREWCDCRDHFLSVSAQRQKPARVVIGSRRAGCGWRPRR